MIYRKTWDLEEREAVVAFLLTVFPFVATPGEVYTFPIEQTEYKIQRNQWGDFNQTGFFEYQIDEYKKTNRGTVHRYLFVNRVMETSIRQWKRQYPDGVERDGLYFLFETRRSKAKKMAALMRELANEG